MFSASEIIPTTKDSTKTTTRIPASIQGQVTAVDEKRSLNTVSEAIMMTTTDAKKLAMATSTLINNARYVILSERVKLQRLPSTRKYLDGTLKFIRGECDSHGAKNQNENQKCKANTLVDQTTAV